jgi:hypothetical protein
VILHNYNLPP